MKKYESLIYSAFGVAALFVVLLLANFVLGAFKQRLDLTAGGLYTLSAGTRAILAKLDAPVKIRLYYSQSEANLPLPIKGFARRVEDLLGEFRQAAGGKLVLEKLDPRPDSEAEDSAAIEGVEAQTLPSGDRFYLGLSVSHADQKIAMPALSLDREQLLEYDVARAISRATRATKPVIGVLSPMPLFGSRGIPQMGVPPSEKLVLVSELERDFEVKRVSAEADRIPEDVHVLLVVNPRGISEQTEYALDQFVLRGGKMVALLDPYAYFDLLPGAREGGTSSTLEHLLKAWGLAMDPTKVVQDLKYVSGGGPQQMSSVLSLNTEAFDPDDISTGRLGFTMFPMVGAFTGKPAEGLKETVLIKSSKFAQLADNSVATTQGEASVRGIKPSGVEYPIAVRLAGRFKTAFPDGPPKPKEDKGAGAGAESNKGESAPLPPQLMESKSDNSAVLIADSDFINDGAAVNIQEVFGQRIVVPANSNLSFVQALVEQYAGDPALTDVRTRAVAARPFTVIREMEAQAAQHYMGKLKQLEDSLQQTQEKLDALQKSQPGRGKAAILTPEQQKEVDNFKRVAAETRLELKEVRRDLRADSEALQFWTKVVNIALMPVLVVLAGIVWAIYRRRRKVAP
ncbi:MAG: GldG family protein [Burkholderiales bacterium]|nr:GldG family protein [Burkholderiales bacterium]